MSNRTVRKFMVCLGIQFQATYVKCRSVENGIAAIRSMMPNAQSVEVQGASDGWGFDIDAND